MKLLCIIFSFSILFFSCDKNPKDERELAALKTSLFKNSNDATSWPIYADPPTGDYEEFAKGKFMFQIDTAEILLIKKYRDELEPMIEARFDSSYTWIYLATYLKYKNAIPILKNKLLHMNNFYGWEEGDPMEYHTNNDLYRRQLEDHDYCAQLTCISAIEYISGQSIERSISLTKNEKDSLEFAAKKCLPDSACSNDFTNSCGAYWLLCKLTGEKPRDYK
jgi:hypothetical protein